MVKTCYCIVLGWQQAWLHGLFSEAMLGQQRGGAGPHWVWGKMGLGKEVEGEGERAGGPAAPPRCSARGPLPALSLAQRALRRALASPPVIRYRFPAPFKKKKKQRAVV
jgi:hypothetical protein